VKLKLTTTQRFGTSLSDGKGLKCGGKERREKGSVLNMNRKGVVHGIHTNKSKSALAGRCGRCGMCSCHPLNKSEKKRKGNHKSRRELDRFDDFALV